MIRVAIAVTVGIAVSRIAVEEPATNFSAGRFLVFIRG